MMLTQKGTKQHIAYFVGHLAAMLSLVEVFCSPDVEQAQCSDNPHHSKDDP